MYHPPIALLHRPRPSHRRLRLRHRRLRPWHWHWQAVIAVLLALLTVEGQPVAASYAMSQAGSAAPWPTARWALPSQGPALPQTVFQPVLQADTAAPEPAAGASANVAIDDRPDLRVTFGPLGAVQAGQPFRVTIQVRNDGATATDGASVSALIPPEMSNVRVTAPGFVCTRLFTPSGPRAGTLVACSRGDLERGALAGVSIEATAPTAAGSYHLTAIADPRDDAPESDEANNDADLTVEVRS